MATNTADGYVVNFKVESVEGTAASGGASTGERLRTLASPGLRLVRGQAQSQEVRNDANAGRVRLTGKRVEGSFNMELSQGSFDTWLEALLRSTWVAADPAITCNNGAAFTSFTITNQNTLTLAGTGSFLTEGVKVGDVIQLSDMSTAANNSVRATVSTVAANVVVVHGTPWTNQSADTACTLTIAKKLAQATTPTRRTFTVEQYLEDIDLTSYFVGCRVTSLRLQMAPGGIVTGTFGLVGLDRVTLATGASPYFTSPTEYTTIPLVASDASIIYNGTTVTKITGFDLQFDIATEVPEVIGSVVAPGSYDNRMTVTGTITAITEDFASVTLFDAETEFELHVRLEEPEADPASFVHLFMPCVKITDIDRPLGGNGAITETRAVKLEPKAAATGYDAGIMTISTAA
jgi:hypothetical protein